MSVSTVKITGTTVMTVSDATATASDVANRKAFYTKDGTKTYGTYVDEDADVLFIDYDGTELYGYTKEAFLALAEMPPNPTHSGLTAQGWNWTLADAKEYVTACNMLVIGQHYITDDGKTRVYISATASPFCALHFYQSISGGVTINWGDGSSEEQISGTGVVGAQHMWQAPGEYVVTLEVTSGVLRLGGGDASNTFYGNINYYRCEGTQIKKIELGNVEKLNSVCLEWCGGLETITIPYKLQLGAAPVRYCQNLKCFIEPSGTDGTNTGSGAAFTYCRNIKYVSLPKSHTTIASYLFNVCFSLRRIHLPLDALIIGNYSCQECRSLKYATYSTSATQLRGYAFYDCFNLKYATPVPSTVTTLQNGIFTNCYDVFETAQYPEGITEITSPFSGITTLKSVTIPSTATSILTQAFQNCYTLANITIPQNVTSIGSKAFFNCFSLNSVTIQGNITTIPEQCFSGCYAIIDFFCPATVTSIETKAFENASSLYNLIMYPTTPPTLAADAFTGCSSINSITVPHGCGNAYKTATNWSTYADIIYEESNE